MHKVNCDMYLHYMLTLFFFIVITLNIFYVYYCGKKFVKKYFVFATSKDV